MYKSLFLFSVLQITFLASFLYAKEKPNFVIVLADDVSWSSFGCFDSGLYTHTPNIDKLASQGVQFTNFMCSVAQCGPIRHELYTGLLPPTSGVYSNGSKPRGDYKNMANYLGELGYHVGLTGKAHFKRVSDFDKIEGFSSDGNSDNPTWEMNGIKKFIESSQSEEKPFCMVIASVHSHHPWTAGKASNFPVDKIVVPPHMVDGPVTREALATHAAEVEELDHQVGATMKLLDDMNLSEDTVLIFLSEQGTAMPKGKWSIYDYGTRALCLARWPGKFKAGEVTDAVAMYCDIVPTLMDIAGGEPPVIDGKSLFPVLKGETSDHRKHAYLVHQASGYSQRAIRNKEFKLMWNPKQENGYYVDTLMDPKSKKFFGLAWQEWVKKAEVNSDAQEKIDRVIKNPEFELYNIKNDPWEMTNLSNNPEYQSTLQEMHAQLKAEMERLNDTFSSHDPKVSKKEKKKMEKTGESTEMKNRDKKKRMRDKKEKA